MHVAIALVLIATWIVPSSAATTAPRICVDRSSPTAALDRAVAQEAVQRLGVTPAFFTYDGSTGVSERFFRYLLRKKCDVLMGFPVDAQYPDLPDGLATTRAYFETGYVLASLHRRETPSSLRSGSAVAVQVGTVPDFYLVGALGPKPQLRPDVYESQERALSALINGSDAVAMVWFPSLVKYESAHRCTPRIFVSPLAIARNRFQLTALYAPANADFAKQFDQQLHLRRTSYETLGHRSLSRRTDCGSLFVRRSRRHER